MNHTAAFVMIAVLVSLFQPTASFAGQSDPAQTTIYELQEPSSYVEGCFDPCMCPIWYYGPVTGTFALTQVESDPYFTTYEITDVDWAVVTFGANEIPITGSGKYIVGGKFVMVHRLELDLQIGGTDAQHFDSDWQVSDEFPAIVATVSINGMVCYDKVIHVASKPAPSQNEIHSSLLADSTYQQGCFDPCLCPIWEEQPMSGEFTIVPIFDYGTYREYKITDVNWQAGGGNVPLFHTLTGGGTYTQIDGFAGTVQRMELDLVIDGAEPKHFDSGVLPVEAAFPEINVVVTMNNFVCYDVVLHIHSKADSAMPFSRSVRVPLRNDLRMAPGSTTSAGSTQQVPARTLVPSTTP